MAFPTVRVLIEGENEVRNIRVHRSDKVGDLKTRLSEMLGRPLEAISLRFPSRRLNDRWLISGYTECTQKTPIVVRIQGGAVAVGEGGVVVEGEVAAAEVGEVDGAEEVAEAVAEVGDVDVAEEVAEAAAEVAEVDGVEEVAEAVAEVGDVDVAEEIAEAAAEVGEVHGAEEVAETVAEVGDVDVAGEVAEAAAEVAEVDVAVVAAEGSEIDLAEGEALRMPRGRVLWLLMGTAMCLTALGLLKMLGERRRGRR